MIPLLPEKHVRLNETILGLGAVVIQRVGDGTSLEDLWDSVKDIKAKKKLIPERIGFEDLVITVDVLHALGAIDMNSEGILSKCA